MTTKTKNKAFTLVEMLIVVGIIVLLMVVAIPTFKAMTGGRSLEAAANNINAVLGRARTEAIGSQRVSGVLFLLDPSTGRVNCVVVQDAGPAAMPSTLTPPYNPTPGAVFLDLTDPAESILLPVGVGLQLLDDDNRNGAVNSFPNDRYIGPNPIQCRTAAAFAFSTTLNVFSEADGNHNDTGVAARCIGAILFDSQGRIVARPYRLKLHTGSAMTSLHRLLRNDQGYEAPSAGANTLVEARPGVGLFAPSPPAGPGEFTTASECRSSVGLALLDYVAFKEPHLNPTSPLTSEFYTDDDSQYSSANFPQAEQHEENWLDANALSYYVNRYNGTLVRGE